MAGIQLLLILLISIVSTCTPTAFMEPADEVAIQLKWLHSAQFAGFYVAQEKGYYAEENIRATFLSGGPGVDIFERIMSGTAHFGITSPEDILIKHDEGKSVIAIATIYRRNPLVFVTLADSGIERPADFLGRIAGLETSEGEVQFRALIKKLGLDISLIEFMPFVLDYSPFYDRRVDITYAYSTVGVLYMRADGHEVNIIWPDDYGIHFFGDTLVTAYNTIRDNPDLVIRFLRATLRGWEETIKNPEAAAATTTKYALGTSTELQTQIIEGSRPLIHTGEDHIGWMKAEAWEEINQTLLAQGILSQPVNLRSVYTTDFLQTIYKGTENETNR